MVGRTEPVHLVYLSVVFRSGESEPCHTPKKFVSNAHDVRTTVDSSIVQSSNFFA